MHATLFSLFACKNLFTEHLKITLNKEQTALKCLHFFFFYTFIQADMKTQAADFTFL